MNINLFLWIVGIFPRSSQEQNVDGIPMKYFSELFDECDKLDFEILDKSYYYTFVIHHPENRIRTPREPCLTLVFVGTVLPRVRYT